MKTLIILIISLFFFNCYQFSNYNLSPRAYKQNSETIFEDDNELLLIDGNDSNLILFASREKSNIFIYSRIINKTTNKSIDVLPDKFRAFGFNKSGKYKELYVYQAQEYVNKIKTSQFVSELLTVINGSIDAINAAKSETYTRYSSSGYSDFFGFSSSSGSATSTTYDNSKKLEAKHRANQELKEQISEHKYEIQNLNDILLKRNTLFPLKSINGYFVIKGVVNYHSKYVLYLPIGNDTFKIVLDPPPKIVKHLNDNYYF